jgi:hypothetical protein
VNTSGVLVARIRQHSVLAQAELNLSYTKSLLRSRRERSQIKRSKSVISCSPVRCCARSSRTTLCDCQLQRNADR